MRINLLFALSVIGCQTASPPPNAHNETVELLRSTLEAQVILNSSVIKAHEAERIAHTYEVCQYKKVVLTLIERLKAARQPVPEPPLEMIDLSRCEPE
jgi:hypothetical protein